MIVSASGAVKMKGFECRKIKCNLLIYTYGICRLKTSGE